MPARSRACDASLVLFKFVLMAAQLFGTGYIFRAMVNNLKPFAWLAFPHTNTSKHLPYFGDELVEFFAPTPKVKIFQTIGSCQDWLYFEYIFLRIHISCSDN